MTERSVERTATRPGSTPTAEDTAARRGLGARIQARISSAATEHRASAGTPTGANAGATTVGAAPPPAPTQPPSAHAARSRAPRRARLRLTRVDPWSVLKTSFLLSIAFGVVTVVAVLMVWMVLDAAGVWDSINQAIRETIGGPETADLDVESYVGTERVVGFTMLVAAVDVVLLTAIATLGAFLYNMAAALLGGIEVTLAEDVH